MKIIEPSVELIDEFDSDAVLNKLERCGRVCYQSEPKGKPEEFIRMLIKRGHESVLEHVSLTFRIICDRGVLAELTRHRLASYSVESTRYCKYGELTFIKPSYWTGNELEAWENFCRSVDGYHQNFSQKSPPEQTRCLLPLSLKTELYMTADLREWRHVLKLRTSQKAHPQMREVAGKILDVFKEKLPVIVEDIGG